MEEFEKIKTTGEHQGYYYKVSDVIKILILGLLCCQKTMAEIHGWASSKRISKLLAEKFEIKIIYVIPNIFFTSFGVCRRAYKAFYFRFDNHVNYFSFTHLHINHNNNILLL